VQVYGQRAMSADRHATLRVEPFPGARVGERPPAHGLRPSDA
jgi:hypothetical protein